MLQNNSLRMLLFDGGYVDLSGSLPRYCWYTTDHLGSVRAVTDSSGNVIARYTYRPYGQEYTMLLGPDMSEPIDSSGVFIPDEPVISDEPVSPEEPGPLGPLGAGIALMHTSPHPTPSPSDWQPFRFGGKEDLKNVGLNLLDFGARMYTPSGMRWTTMDPMAEKYYDISPYVYCAGNPVNLVDPEGLSWYYSNVDGSFVSHIDDEDDKIYLISQKQIEAANGDEKTLQSYRSDNNIFGLLAFEKELDLNVAKGVISDLFDRANKKTEGGEETYVAKPEINITHDISGNEASSTTKVLNANLGSSGFYNGYDVINLLSHEIEHTLHRKEVGEKEFKDLPKSVIELRADNFSIRHWSYDRTSDYRKEKIDIHMNWYKSNKL